MDPGPAGNVKELAINAVEGSLALAVRVINTKPTMAGSVRPVRVVTEADKKKLEEQLLVQLKQNAPSVLRAALKPEEILSPDSVLVNTTDKLFDRAVDEPVEVLSLKMNANAFGWGVDKDDLNLLLGTLLHGNLRWVINCCRMVCAWIG